MKQKQIKKLNELKKIENFNYLEDLLNPEVRKGVRIPAQFAVPSSTFQLKTSLTVSTNDKGCFVFKGNPYFLCQPSILGGYWDKVWKEGNNTYDARFFLLKDPTSFFFSNDTRIDGYTNPNEASFHWEPLVFGQLIPNNIYNQYRLVSAVLKVSYVGPLEEVSGVLGGAILFEDQTAIGSIGYQTVTTNTPNTTVFDPNFSGTTFINGPSFKGTDLIFDGYRDCFYHHEGSPLEGLRLLYFPPDKSYEEFVCMPRSEDITGQENIINHSGVTGGFFFELPEDEYRCGFNWGVYGQGLPPSKNCIRFELCANFECLPDVKMLNFIPLSLRPCALSDPERKRIVEELKKKAIGKK